MKSRREFLDVLAKGAGAACLAGLAIGTKPADAAPAEGTVATKSQLLEVLEAVGKPPRVVTNPDGSCILLLPYGGRVLGLFAPGSEDNFYWTHPALVAAETARAFYAGADWHNSGGDRTWLAPEVDIFLTKYPDTNTYWQPRQLDPGNYEVMSSKHGLQLVNTLSVVLSRSGKEIPLRLTKSVGPARNPLRNEKDIDLGALAYAGYTQFTTLEIQDEPGQDEPPVGLWNLVQMPHGGDLLIPTFSRTEPTVWFGNIAADDLHVGDHLVRYKMRATGEQKLGIRAVATTGRVGYLYGRDDQWMLIIRNYVVNPSGEYVDVPWKHPEDLGYSTQACNVNSDLGSFSELEYHVPAIGGDTGRMSCHDAAQVWAFRGPQDAVKSVGRYLLSPQV